MVRGSTMRHNLPGHRSIVERAGRGEWVTCASRDGLDTHGGGERAFEITKPGVTFVSFRSIWRQRKFGKTSEIRRGSRSRRWVGGLWWNAVERSGWKWGSGSIHTMSADTTTDRGQR